MCYVVLDLEWNQPERRQKRVEEPVRLYGEIIQIGAVKVDDNLNIIDRFNVIIKPVFYTKMHSKVTELTGITNDIIAEGVSFKEAIESFRAWCDGSTLLTWGPSDIMYLEDNLLVHNMDIDWIPEDYDAQLIFDDVYTMEARNFSLAHAMFKLKIKPVAFHDALNDAINTVKVLQNIDFHRGIAEYYMA